MRPEIVYLSAAGAVPLLPEDATPRAPLAVIADFVDEAVERVTLPRVRGADASRLLARQLALRLPDTRYRVALRLPAQPGQDTHLLVGAPAAGLDALLVPAAAAGRAVLGVWTVALLVAWWVRRAGLNPARQLVVVPTPAGVRHIFLANGMPVVSRLIPRDLSGRSADASMGAELERTVQYLYNARLAERDTQLAAWVFGGESSELVASARAPLRWEPVPQPRGLPDAGARGLVALAEQLARRPPRTQLAPAELRVHVHARQVKRATAAVAGIFAAMLAANAVSAWSDAALQAQATTAIEWQTAQAQRAHEVAQAAAAASGSTAQTAVGAIEVYEREVERAPQPGPAFALLARAFDAVPAYTLRELRWRAAPADAPAHAADAAAAQDCGLPDGVRADVHVYLAGEVAAATPLRQTVAARQRFEALLATTAADVQVQQAPIEPAGPLTAAVGARAFAYCVYLKGVK